MTDIEAKRQAVIDAAIAWKNETGDVADELAQYIVDAVYELEDAMKPDIKAALAGAITNMCGPCHRCYDEDVYTRKYDAYIHAWKACEDALRHLQENEQ